jgi:SAM-dependent methyltransferase
VVPNTLDGPVTDVNTMESGGAGGANEQVSAPDTARLPSGLAGDEIACPTTFNDLKSLDGVAWVRPDFLRALGATLKGSGVEFGAGPGPLPVGEHCKVRYADRNSNEQLRERGYFGDSPVVEQDLLSDFETMIGVEPGSVDFIIASHVIEHTANPLLALHSAFDRLRTGGRLVLVVPDKNVTFDRDRPITTMEHLLADYTRPCRERDWEHYIEFMAISFPQPDPLLAAQGPFDQGHDIHYHVWTYESFGVMIRYACEKIDPWSFVWSHRRLSEQDIEFYFVLVK